ncbi:MAG: GNAT family N-acetyltransferase [Clostridia bacterium]|nr:GNAT family N-acetyltransferase [Clostridia bacterium]MDE7306129.1 GNAT family N-acetyltransferase [Clostridia bacterium]
MVIEEKQVQLKNGLQVTFKCPQENDAAELLDFMRTVHAETEFMPRTLSEIEGITREQQGETLSAICNSERSVMLAAFLDEEIIGYCIVDSVSDKTKFAHRAGLVISVKKRFWNIGLGSALLESACEFAFGAGFGQVEADVVSKNVLGIQMFKHSGFITAGMLPRAQKLMDGTYNDYICFVKYFKR